MSEPVFVQDVTSTWTISDLAKEHVGNWSVILSFNTTLCEVVPFQDIFQSNNSAGAGLKWLLYRISSCFPKQKKIVTKTCTGVGAVKLTSLRARTHMEEESEREREGGSILSSIWSTPFWTGQLQAWMRQPCHQQPLGSQQRRRWTSFRGAACCNCRRSGEEHSTETHCAAQVCAKGCYGGISHFVPGINKRYFLMLFICSKSFKCFNCFRKHYVWWVVWLSWRVQNLESKVLVGGMMSVIHVVPKPWYWCEHQLG